MLTAVITAPSFKSALDQILKLPKAIVCLELRLDYLSALTLHDFKTLQSNTKRPILLTLRTQSQGGRFQGSVTDYQQRLMSYAQWGADYLDVESHLADIWIAELQLYDPSLKIIRSVHFLNHTPQNLSEKLEQIYHPKAYGYKLISYANTLFDSINMMTFLKAHAHHPCLSLHCMGELGHFSRIIGKILGNYFTYISSSQNTAPGILTYEEALSIYRLQKTDQRTHVYALLGNPINHSMGHKIHNDYFSEAKINAVYLKIPLDQACFLAFMKAIQPLPFKGFSLTMPLKKICARYYPHPYHAANTLTQNQHHQWASENTDGIGLCQTLHAQGIIIKQTKILLIGAGGAAYGIAHALKDEGAQITIMNRTRVTAQCLAQKIGGRIFIKTLKEPFSLIINTAPKLEDSLYQALKDSIDQSDQKPILMDICYQSPVPELTQLAQIYGCDQISGKAMFIYQAMAQQTLWAPPPVLQSQAHLQSNKAAQ